ncbi:hypothetical protein [Streptomonospora sediminis]
MDSLQEYRDSARQDEVPERIIDWFVGFARRRAGRKKVRPA